MKIASSDKTIEYLQRKWGSAGCPMCGGNEWNVSEKIFELREFSAGKRMVGESNGAILPVVPVICNNCGNTMFINALFIGLLEEE